MKELPMEFHNPVLPGFHPDPSVCRVGDDFYLVVSSFEFFPGLPLFHSRDLAHWTSIGHAIHRPGQLDFSTVPPSGGLWAPTIRHHNGVFYVLCTHEGQGGNFIVTAMSPEGPWSDPVFFEPRGIDPSLFFDDDGQVYYSSNGHDEQERFGITVAPFDLANKRFAAPPRVVWFGAGGRCVEAPHLYKHGGFYYLVTAEGGTDYGHMVAVARASLRDGPYGPFESCPDNPILTHKNEGRIFPFQAIGHADFVEDAHGDWWMVCLGFRPFGGKFHHLGREVFLAPVEWVDGWPVINQRKVLTPVMTSDRALMKNAMPVSQDAVRDFATDFDESVLGLRWSRLRNPRPESYDLQRRPGWLTLAGTGVTLDQPGSPTFIGIRQPEPAVTVRARVAVDPQQANDAAGLTVYHCPDHHYDLIVTRVDGRRVARVRKSVADIRVFSDPIALPAEGDVTLRLEATAEAYRFWVEAEGVAHPVGVGCTRLLAAEATSRSFTGCFIGLFAENAILQADDFILTVRSE